MHFNAFQETGVGLAATIPEVVYRSRGPPLSVLHNMSLMSRTHNVITEMQKGNAQFEIVNAMASLRLGPPSSPGVVMPCGINHTELEVVAVGGQLSPKPQGTQLPDCQSPKNSFESCLEAVLTAEFPFLTETGAVNQGAGCNAQEDQPDPWDFDACHQSAELENGRECIPEHVFRFKRLARIRPRSFGTDRIIDVVVDDKQPHPPFVYARNANGFCLARLQAEADYSGSRLDSSIETPTWFPSVVPQVVADLSFTAENAMNTLFVSPHEYGVFATTTRNKQLVVWDSTVSAPQSKINLFRSSERNLSYSEMYNRWYGCVASDTIECGTFTDRPDCILIGGSKLYLADLRTRSMGHLFPQNGTRPPLTYQFPRLSSRLPVPDKFIAIARHPTVSTLYAVVSAVSSSILLWDIRNPWSVLTELPLPLIRHGRGRYRSLRWHVDIPDTCEARREPVSFLSSFCWSHACVAVNALSVYNSGSIDVRSTQEQKLWSHVKQKGSLVRPSQSPLLPDLLRTPPSSRSNSTFWTAEKESLENKRSAFFVNPFTVFPSPCRSALLVGDPSGLCFSSSRPPIQVVVYQQLQWPMGVPSIVSERRYFEALGPIITSPATLYNEGLHAPLAEAPLSQLFHGIAGIGFLSLRLPSLAKDGRRFLVLLSLTFSGRLLCSVLTVGSQPRRLMLLETPSKPCASSSSNNLTNNVLEALSRLFAFPDSKICSHLPTAAELPGDRRCASFARNPWLPVSLGTLKKGLDALGTQPKPLFFRSLFPSACERHVQQNDLRGLHELLRPNNDALEHRSFLMGPKMTFARQRLETLVFWRHPDLNSIYFPSALLEILLGGESFRHHASDATGDTASSLVHLDTISGAPRRPLDVVAKRGPTHFDAMPEWMRWIAQLPIGTSLTLNELRLSWHNLSVVKQQLQHVLNLLDEGSLETWLSSTAGLEKQDLNIAPSRIAKVSPRLVPGRLGTPICACAPFVSGQPVMVDSGASRVGVFLWSVLAPEEESLTYRTTPARSALETVATGAVHGANIAVPLPFAEKTALTVLCDQLLSNPHIPWLWGAALRPRARRGPKRKHATTVGGGCTLQRNFKLPNPCLMPDLCVFRVVRPLNGTTGASVSTLETDLPIQGERLIQVDAESLRQSSRKERQFIYDYAIRDYPAYYTFLSGVRLTTALYDNLRRFWPLQRLSHAQPVAIALHSTTKTLLETFFSQKSASSSVSLLARQSLALLPFYVSTAAYDSAVQDASQKCQEAIGVLSSQSDSVAASAHTAPHITQRDTSFTSSQTSAALLHFMLRSSQPEAEPSTAEDSKDVATDMDISTPSFWSSLSTNTSAPPGSDATDPLRNEDRGSPFKNQAKPDMLSVVTAPVSGLDVSAQPSYATGTGLENQNFSATGLKWVTTSASRDSPCYRGPVSLNMLLALLQRLNTAETQRLRLRCFQEIQCVLSNPFTVVDEADIRALVESLVGIVRAQPGGSTRPVSSIWRRRRTSAGLEAPCAALGEALERLVRVLIQRHRQYLQPESCCLLVQEILNLLKSTRYCANTVPALDAYTETLLAFVASGTVAVSLTDALTEEVVDALLRPVNQQLLPAVQEEDSRPSRTSPARLLDAIASLLETNNQPSCRLTPARLTQLVQESAVAFIRLNNKPTRDDPSHGRLCSAVGRLFYYLSHRLPLITVEVPAFRKALILLLEVGRRQLHPVMRGLIVHVCLKLYEAMTITVPIQAWSYKPLPIFLLTDHDDAMSIELKALFTLVETRFAEYLQQLLTTLRSAGAPPELEGVWLKEDAEADLDWVLQAFKRQKSTPDATLREVSKKLLFIVATFLAEQLLVEHIYIPLYKVFKEEGLSFERELTIIQNFMKIVVEQGLQRIWESGAHGAYASLFVYARGFEILGFLPVADIASATGKCHLAPLWHLCEKLKQSLSARRQRSALLDETTEVSAVFQGTVQHYHDKQAQEETLLSIAAFSFILWIKAYARRVASYSWDAENPRKLNRLVPENNSETDLTSFVMSIPWRASPFISASWCLFLGYPVSEDAQAWMCFLARDHLWLPDSATQEVLARCIDVFGVTLLQSIIGILIQDLQMRHCNQEDCSTGPPASTPLLLQILSVLPAKEEKMFELRAAVVSAFCLKAAPLNPRSAGIIYTKAYLLAVLDSAGFLFFQGAVSLSQDLFELSWESFLYPVLLQIIILVQNRASLFPKCPPTCCSRTLDAPLSFHTASPRCVTYCTVSKIDRWLDAWGMLLRPPTDIQTLSCRDVALMMVSLLKMVPLSVLQNRKPPRVLIQFVHTCLCSTAFGNPVCEATTPTQWLSKPSVTFVDVLQQIVSAALALLQHQDGQHITDCQIHQSSQQNVPAIDIVLAKLTEQLSTVWNVLETVFTGQAPSALLDLAGRWVDAIFTQWNVFDKKAQAGEAAVGEDVPEKASADLQASSVPVSSTERILCGVETSFKNQNGKEPPSFQEARSLSLSPCVFTGSGDDTDNDFEDLRELAKTTKRRRLTATQQTLRGVFLDENCCQKAVSAIEKATACSSSSSSKPPLSPPLEGLFGMATSQDATIQTASSVGLLPHRGLSQAVSLQQVSFLLQQSSHIWQVLEASAPVTDLLLQLQSSTAIPLGHGLSFAQRHLLRLLALKALGSWTRFTKTHDTPLASLWCSSVYGAVAAIPQMPPQYGTESLELWISTLREILRHSGTSDSAAQIRQLFGANVTACDTKSLSSLPFWSLLETVWAVSQSTRRCRFLAYLLNFVCEIVLELQHQQLAHERTALRVPADLIELIQSTAESFCLLWLSQITSPAARSSPKDLFREDPPVFPEMVVRLATHVPDSSFKTSLLGALLDICSHMETVYNTAVLTASGSFLKSLPQQLILKNVVRFHAQILQTLLPLRALMSSDLCQATDRLLIQQYRSLAETSLPTIQFYLQTVLRCCDSSTPDLVIDPRKMGRVLLAALYRLALRREIGNVPANGAGAKMEATWSARAYFEVLRIRLIQLQKKSTKASLLPWWDAVLRSTESDVVNAAAVVLTLSNSLENDNSIQFMSPVPVLVGFIEASFQKILSVEQWKQCLKSCLSRYSAAPATTDLLLDVIRLQNLYVITEFNHGVGLADHLTALQTKLPTEIGVSSTLNHLFLEPILLERALLLDEPDSLLDKEKLSAYVDFVCWLLMMTKKGSECPLSRGHDTSAACFQVLLKAVVNSLLHQRLLGVSVPISRLVQTTLAYLQNAVTRSAGLTLLAPSALPKQKSSFKIPILPRSPYWLLGEALALCARAAPGAPKSDGQKKTIRLWLRDLFLAPPQETLPDNAVVDFCQPLLTILSGLLSQQLRWQKLSGDPSHGGSENKKKKSLLERLGFETLFLFPPLEALLQDVGINSFQTLWHAICHRLREAAVAERSEPLLFPETVETLLRALTRTNPQDLMEYCRRPFLDCLFSWLLQFRPSAEIGGCELLLNSDQPPLNNTNTEKFLQGFLTRAAALATRMGRDLHRESEVPYAFPFIANKVVRIPHSKFYTYFCSEALLYLTREGLTPAIASILRDLRLGETTLVSHDRYFSEKLPLQILTCFMSANNHPSAVSSKTRKLSKSTNYHALYNLGQAYRALHVSHRLFLLYALDAPLCCCQCRSFFLWWFWSSRKSTNESFTEPDAEAQMALFPGGWSITLSASCTGPDFLTSAVFASRAVPHERQIVWLYECLQRSIEGQTSSCEKVFQVVRIVLELGQTQTCHDADLEINQGFSARWWSTRPVSTRLTLLLWLLSCLSFKERPSLNHILTRSALLYISSFDCSPYLALELPFLLIVHLLASNQKNNERLPSTAELINFLVNIPNAELFLRASLQNIVFALCVLRYFSFSSFPYRGIGPASYRIPCQSTLCHGSDFSGMPVDLNRSSDSTSKNIVGYINALWNALHFDALAHLCEKLQQPEASHFFACLQANNISTFKNNTTNSCLLLQSLADADIGLPDAFYGTLSQWMDQRTLLVESQIFAHPWRYPLLENARFYSHYQHHPTFATFDTYSTHSVQRYFATLPSNTGIPQHLQQWYAQLWRMQHWTPSSKKKPQYSQKGLFYAGADETWSQDTFKDTNCLAWDTRGFTFQGTGRRTNNPIGSFSSTDIHRAVALAYSQPVLQYEQALWKAQQLLQDTSQMMLLLKESHTDLERALQLAAYSWSCSLPSELALLLHLMSHKWTILSVLATKSLPNVQSDLTEKWLRDLHVLHANAPIVPFLESTLAWRRNTHLAVVAASNDDLKTIYSVCYGATEALIFQQQNRVDLALVRALEIADMLKVSLGKRCIMSSTVTCPESASAAPTFTYEQFLEILAQWSLSQRIWAAGDYRRALFMASALSLRLRSTIQQHIPRVVKLCFASALSQMGRWIYESQWDTFTQVEQHYFVPALQLNLSAQDSKPRMLPTCCTRTDEDKSDALLMTAATWALPCFTPPHTPLLFQPAILDNLAHKEYARLLDEVIQAQSKQLAFGDASNEILSVNGLKNELNATLEKIKHLHLRPAPNAADTFHLLEQNAARLKDALEFQNALKSRQSQQLEALAEKSIRHYIKWLSTTSCSSRPETLRSCHVDVVMGTSLSVYYGHAYRFCTVKLNFLSDFLIATNMQDISLDPYRSLQLPYEKQTHLSCLPAWVILLLDVRKSATARHIPEPFKNVSHKHKTPTAL